jgi:hypothetical protein
VLKYLRFQKAYLPHSQAGVIIHHVLVAMYASVRDRNGKITHVLPRH